MGFGRYGGQVPSRRLEALQQLLDTPSKGRAEDIPSSAVKSFRGNQTQVQVAMKAGISQEMLSAIETGSRELTETTAKKLAPVLGVKAKDLMIAERVGSMKRAAMKGQLSPERLLDAILVLDQELPESGAADELLDAMVDVLKRSLEIYQEQGGAEAFEDEFGPEQEQELEEQPEFLAATKSKATRDIHGRRLDKEFGPRADLKGQGAASLKSEQDQPGSRNPMGLRRNKPNDPNPRR